MTREIPTPEFDNPKEVFAFFGLAFYNAQVLEQALINFAVALHAKGLTRVTVGDVNNLYNKFDRHTFGQLINAAKKVVNIGSSLERDLEKAVKKRNYLAHEFFKDNDANFISEQGRIKMINDLRDTTKLLIEVDEQFKGVWMAAWEALGITEQWWNEQYRKSRARILDSET